MDWQKFIQITPGVRSGKACIVGTRITHRMCWTISPAE
jgi:uncharacterized protein (DUF433 family)